MPVLNRSQLPHNAKVYEKLCPKCTVIFYANKPSAKYCSNRCKQRAYLDRKEKSSIKPIPKVDYMADGKIITMLIDVNEICSSDIFTSKKEVKELMDSVLNMCEVIFSGKHYITKMSHKYSETCLKHAKELADLANSRL